MNHLRLILWGGLLTLVVLGAGASGTLAQDEPQQPPDAQPKPAARSNPIPVVDSGEQDENPNQGNPIQPDTTPLTGVLSPTLGTFEAQHSYWIAGLQYATSIQDNGYGSSGWFNYNYVAGNFSLLEAWSHSQLVVNYSGGGYFSSNNGSGNGSYQGLSMAQTFTYNRWNFQIEDYFTYLPQSSYGFGGGTNLGVPGIGGSTGVPAGTTVPGIGNAYLPNQSLYGGLGPQYSNTGVLQGTYSFSRRSSITVSGTYSILNFVDPGYIDTNALFAGVGYNYAFTPKDTIGVLYHFSSYHFPGDPQAYGSQIVSLAYGRKITGRIALGLFGGPQYTTFRIPLGTSSSQLGGYASVFLNYSTENGTLGVNYVHGLSGGGGLLVGSILDQVNFLVTRRLTRLWSANANFSYAHNRTVISTGAPANTSYSSWYAGGSLSRPFGRYVILGFGYTASISKYNLSGCSGASCGPSSNSLYQTINASLQWHTRPFVLH